MSACFVVFVLCITSAPAAPQAATYDGSVTVESEPAEDVFGLGPAGEADDAAGFVQGDLAPPPAAAPPHRVASDAPAPQPPLAPQTRSTLPSAPPGAGRPDLRVFRNEGDLFIAGASAFALGGHYVSTAKRSESDFAFSLQLGMGYFASNYFAAGGFLSTSIAGGAGARAVGFAMGPQFTARFGIGTGSSFLPSLGLGYGLVHTSAAGGMANANLFVAELDLPFAIDLFPGVLLTVGPYVRPALGQVSAGGSSVDTTQVDFGFRLGLLGWR